MHSLLLLLLLAVVACAVVVASEVPGCQAYGITQTDAGSRKELMKAGMTPVSDACARTAEAMSSSTSSSLSVNDAVLSVNDAVLCYAGTFYTKMLSELNGGNAKSPEHVHVHLLPYLAGETGLKELQSGQSPDDAKCSVCYSDEGAAKGLMALRDSIDAAALKGYDALDICVYELTAAIVALTPKENGMLKPTPNANNEGEAAWIILSALNLVNVEDGCRIKSAYMQPTITQSSSS